MYILRASCPRSLNFIPIFHALHGHNLYNSSCISWNVHASARISQASPSTPTWFVDKLSCSGSKSRQTNCIFGDKDCSHSDDIALICGRDSTTSELKTLLIVSVCHVFNKC